MSFLLFVPSKYVFIFFNNHLIVLFLSKPPKDKSPHSPSFLITLNSFLFLQAMPFVILFPPPLLRRSCHLKTQMAYSDWVCITKKPLFPQITASIETLCRHIKLSTKYGVCLSNSTGISIYPAFHTKYILIITKNYLQNKM